MNHNINIRLTYEHNVVSYEVPINTKFSQIKKFAQERFGLSDLKLKYYDLDLTGLNKEPIISFCKCSNIFDLTVEEVTSDPLECKCRKEITYLCRTCFEFLCDQCKDAELHSDHIVRIVNNDPKNLSAYKTSVLNHLNDIKLKTNTIEEDYRVEIKKEEILKMVEEMYNNFDYCLYSQKILKNFDFENLTSISKNIVEKTSKTLPHNDSRDLFLKLSQIDSLSSEMLKRVQMVKDIKPVFLKMKDVQCKLVECIKGFNDVFTKFVKYDESEFKAYKRKKDAQAGNKSNDADDNEIKYKVNKAPIVRSSTTDSSKIINNLIKRGSMLSAQSTKILPPIDEARKHRKSFNAVSPCIQTIEDVYKCSRKGSNESYCELGIANIAEYTMKIVGKLTNSKASKKFIKRLSTLRTSEADNKQNKKSNEAEESDSDLNGNNKCKLKLNEFNYDDVKDITNTSSYEDDEQTV